MNQKIGRDLFLAAHRDFFNGRISRRGPSHIAAIAFSIIVLATPFLLIGAGLVMAVMGFPGFLALVLGVTFMMAGWIVLPRRARVRGTPKRRSDLPELFDLTDRIAAQLGTEPLTGILFEDDFNGWVAELRIRGRNERILVIGILLWASATDQEKIAFLGHEMGHLVNQDPARSTIIRLALDTLDGWAKLLGPSRINDHGTGTYYDVDDGALVSLVSAGPRLIAEGLHMGLERLNYLASQRAEYLADAKGAGVSGAESAIALLEKIEMVPLIQQEIVGLRPSPDMNGKAFITRLVAPVKNAKPEAKQNLQSRAQDTLSSVDRTHPPSAYRIAFLRLLQESEHNNSPFDVDFPVLEAEIDPYIVAAGEKMVADIQVQ